MPDVDQLYARCNESGTPVLVPLEERWYRNDFEELGNRQFVAIDPDGFLLRFFSDLGSRALS